MAAIRIEEPPAGADGRRIALFDAGFRPFFLLAAWSAALALAVWLSVWTGHLAFDPPVGILRWHGHEMLFGFAAAGLAGFILTAVPTWTATVPVRGWRLALLVVLWLAGRAGMAGPVPASLAAVLDVAFLPALALAVAPAILRSAQRRNRVFILILIVLAAGNAAFHADLPGFDPETALRLALGILVLMIGLVGGRIVPAFSQSGLRAAGRAITLGPTPVLDRWAAVALLAAILADVAGTPALACAAVAAVAALLHAIRLAAWQGWRAAGVPLVWVMHAGYAWLPVGAALLAAAHLDLVGPSAALHAWGAGAVGTMLIAVMSRASLGHAGRALVADGATVVAYGLVIAGAALRVGGAIVGAPAEFPLLVAGGAGWSLGYLIFAVRYLPIWLRPLPGTVPA